MQNSSQSVRYNGVHARPNVPSLAMHSSVDIYTAIAEYSGTTSAMRFLDVAVDRLLARGDAELPRGVSASADSRIPIVHCAARTTTCTRGWT